MIYHYAMKVEVHRTIKNIFRAKREGNKIVVVANWLLSLKEIKQILQDNNWTNGRIDETSCKNGTEKCATENTKSSRETGRKVEVETACARTMNENKDGFDDTAAGMFCGKKVMLCGEVYDVCPSLVTKTHIDDNKIYVHEDVYSDKAERLKALKVFLKRMARMYLSSEVSDFGTRAGVCPEKIDFRELKDGWTKCSDAVKKLVCIDYRVVQLPTLLRRYVIVHTFCHFKYPDHDNRFWNAVSNYLPNYADYKRQLEQYDFLLEI